MEDALPGGGGGPQCVNPARESHGPFGPNIVNDADGPWRYGPARRGAAQARNGRGSGSPRPGQNDQPRPSC